MSVRLPEAHLYPTSTVPCLFAAPPDAVPGSAPPVDTALTSSETTGPAPDLVLTTAAFEVPPGESFTCIYLDHTVGPEGMAVQWTRGQQGAFGQKGTRLRMTCTWSNPDTAITFPQEMCLGSMLYFPGAGGLNCAPDS